MKRRETKPTVRYFASTREQGFADDTLYVAHEANGQNWHITKAATRTPRHSGIDTSVYLVKYGSWKEVTLPDYVLYNIKEPTRTPRNTA